jgi:hypothetical protein
MGELVSLEVVRARRLPVPLREPIDDPYPPQAMIRAAADLWLVDSIRDVADQLLNHITRTNAPLDPKVRASVMRASAALLGQPEGVA